MKRRVKGQRRKTYSTSHLDQAVAMCEARWGDQFCRQDVIEMMRKIEDDACKSSFNPLKTQTTQKEA